MTARYTPRGRDDGGQAFPDSGTHEGRQWAPAGGMTLRDYFASKVLPEALRQNAEREVPVNDPYIAGLCYDMADAMLEARKK